MCPCTTPFFGLAHLTSRQKGRPAAGGDFLRYPSACRLGSERPTGHAVVARCLYMMMMMGIVQMSSCRWPRAPYPSPQEKGEPRIHTDLKATTTTDPPHHDHQQTKPLDWPMPVVVQRLSNPLDPSTMHSILHFQARPSRPRCIVYIDVCIRRPNISRAAVNLLPLPEQ